MVGKRSPCPLCQQTIALISGETLPVGGGAGDFDAGLIVTAGPRDVGMQLLLGGVADVQIGKLPERQIVLHGGLVSRLHCKLSRIDFEPSRWKVTDNHSTNGLFVNGERVSERVLEEGDVVSVGEYRLEFARAEAQEELALAAPSASPSALSTAAARQPSGFGRTTSMARPAGHRRRRAVGLRERADLSQL